MKYNKRNSPEYQSWRKEILKRDKHKCQYPGCNKRRSLEIHHIQTWAKNPFLRYDIGNGITLCRNHHSMIRGSEEYYVSLFLQIVSKNENNN